MELNERIDKHEAYIERMDRFIAAMETANAYDKEFKLETKAILKELTNSKIEHDKRLAVLETLPAQIKDIQDSRTIKTDKWVTSKLNSVMFGGTMVLIIGTMITFTLFLKKLFDIMPK